MLLSLVRRLVAEVCYQSTELAIKDLLDFTEFMRHVDSTSFINICTYQQLWCSFKFLCCKCWEIRSSLKVEVNFFF